MIEINLLPVGIRTTEGTPPKRFIMYVGFLVTAAVLCIYVFKWKYVEIPKANERIEVSKKEVETLTAKKTEVEQISAEIDKVNKKIQDLDDLNLSRVRF